MVLFYTIVSDLKRDLKFSKKRGETMSEIRQTLAESIDDVRNGKLPLDSAQQIHKLAHRHVMDRYADDKEARRIGDEKVAARLRKAQDKLRGV
jgi:hypothetical protein